MAQQQMKPEPQSAADYDERTTAAVKSVLVEMGQILGSYKGKFAVVGGAVPWLLLENEDMAHVGTLDIDIALNAAALKDEDEYKDLIEGLMENGYSQRTEHKKFQLVRKVNPKDGGPAIDVIVDFLMPRDVQLTRNKPALIDNFAVQRADGADLALQFYQMVAIDGAMPAGGKNRVEIAIASIPALLAMKGYAIQNRHKQKDSYDIYYCIRNRPARGETRLRIHRGKIRQRRRLRTDFGAQVRGGNTSPRRPHRRPMANGCVWTGAGLA